VTSSVVVYTWEYICLIDGKVLASILKARAKCLWMTGYGNAGHASARHRLPVEEKYKG
jgi:hypothetical protein